MISSLEQDKYKISLKYVAGTEGKKSEQKKKNHVKVIHCKKKKRSFKKKPTERAPNHKSWDNLNYKINKINIHEAILIKKMKTNIP